MPSTFCSYLHTGEDIDKLLKQLGDVIINDYSNIDGDQAADILNSISERMERSRPHGFVPGAWNGQHFYFNVGNRHMSYD